MMSTTSSQTYEIGHTPISMPFRNYVERNSLNSPQMARKLYSTTNYKQTMFADT